MLERLYSLFQTTNCGVSAPNQLVSHLKVATELNSVGRGLDRFQRVCTLGHSPAPFGLDVVNSGRGTGGAGVRDSRYRKFIRSISRLEFFSNRALSLVGGYRLLAIKCVRSHPRFS